MPIYEYECKDCHHCFDARRPISEADAEIACPECGGKNIIRKLSRVFSSRNSGSPRGTASSCSGRSCRGCTGCG